MGLNEMIRFETFVTRMVRVRVRVRVRVSVRVRLRLS